MPPPIPVTKQVLPIAFGMQEYSSWSHYIDESIYVPYIHFFKAQKTLNETDGTYYTKNTDEVIKAVPCSKDSFVKPTIQNFID